MVECSLTNVQAMSEWRFTQHSIHACGMIKTHVQHSLVLKKLKRVQTKLKKTKPRWTKSIQNLPTNINMTIKNR